MEDWKNCLRTWKNGNECISLTPDSSRIHFPCRSQSLVCENDNSVDSIQFIRWRLSWTLVFDRLKVESEKNGCGNCHVWKKNKIHFQSSKSSVRLYSLPLLIVNHPLHYPHITIVYIYIHILYALLLHILYKSCILYECTLVFSIFFSSWFYESKVKVKKKDQSTCSLCTAQNIRIKTSSRLVYLKNSFLQLLWEDFVLNNMNCFCKKTTYNFDSHQHWTF